MDYWITKIKTNNLEEEEINTEFFNFQPETIFDLTRQIFDKFKLEFSIYVLLLLGSKLHTYLRAISLQFERQTILSSIPSIVVASPSHGKILSGCSVNQEETESNKQKEDDKECILCLTQIFEGKQLNCGHVFHEICLGEYLDRNYNLQCPLCGLHLLDSRINHSKILAKKPYHRQLLCKMIDLVDPKSNKIRNVLPKSFNGRFFIIVCKRIIIISQIKKT